MQNKSNAHILGKIAGSLLYASEQHRPKELVKIDFEKATEWFKEAMEQYALADDARKDALEGFADGWGAADADAKSKGLTTLPS